MANTNTQHSIVVVAFEVNLKSYSQVNFLLTNYDLKMCLMRRKIANALRRYMLEDWSVSIWAFEAAFVALYLSEIFNQFAPQ